MAKCIYVYSRNRLPNTVSFKLKAICRHLEPENIEATQPEITVNGSVAYGIMNPTKTLSGNDRSLLVGQLFDHCSDWDIPRAGIPDGSFALFRSNENYCELVTDAAASRTIWYYKDENVFLSSTSQRALIMFLQSFEFNETVIPWMLSTGTIGPGFSWDKRIKQAPPDSTVLLERNSWSISVQSKSIEFNSVEGSKKQHKQSLIEALKSTLGNLNIDFDNWTLPLSGGYDSRGILCLLKETSNRFQNLTTITWGLQKSRYQQRNDAYVAKNLRGILI